MNPPITILESLVDEIVFLQRGTDSFVGTLTDEPDDTDPYQYRLVGVPGTHFDVDDIETLSISDRNQIILKS